MMQVSNAPAHQPLPSTDANAGSTASTSSATAPDASSGALGAYSTVPPAQPLETEPLPLEEGPVPDAPLQTSLPRPSYGAIAAALMQQMASDQLLESLTKSLETQQKVSTGLTEENVKKIEEMCRKAEAAERARRAGDAIGWIKAVGGLVLGTAGLIGAGVLAFKSGGAAAGLLVPAFMGFQASLAAFLAKADPDIKGYYVGEIGSSTMAIAEASGASPGDAAKIAIAASVLATVLIIGASLSRGDFTKVSDGVKLAAKIMQIASMAFNGSMDVAQGTNQLDAAETELARAKIQIESKKLEAAMAQAQELMELFTALVAAVSKADKERNDTLADSLQDDAGTMQAAIANFS